MEGIRKRFVRKFWAAHNDSPAVRREIRLLLDALGGGRGLNVGCGDTRLDPRMVNVDLAVAPAVAVLADALALPFAGDCFALIISQETVEHVPDPFQAVREMARVLRPGGRLYLQAPFIIGYHPGPEDYWRFSRAGMRRLVEQAELDCQRVEPAVGAGTGMYRITVEFFADLFARVLPALYLPVKAAGSVFFYPLAWWNGLLSGGSNPIGFPEDTLPSPSKRKPREVNVLFTSAGRRVELLRAFRRAYRSLKLGERFSSPISSRSRLPFRLPMQRCWCRGQTIRSSFLRCSRSSGAGA